MKEVILIAIFLCLFTLFIVYETHVSVFLLLAKVENDNFSWYVMWLLETAFP